MCLFNWSHCEHTAFVVFRADQAINFLCIFTFIYHNKLASQAAEESICRNTCFNCPPVLSLSITLFIHLPPAPPDSALPSFPCSRHRLIGIGLAADCDGFWVLCALIALYLPVSWWKRWGFMSRPENGDREPLGMIKEKLRVVLHLLDLQLKRCGDGSISLCWRNPEVNGVVCHVKDAAFIARRCS